MKSKLFITLPILLISIGAMAQNKPVEQKKQDSVKFALREVQTIRNNAVIIQQTLHRMDMSSLLRDKLDSVFNQSVIIIDERLRGKKP